MRFAIDLNNELSSMFDEIKNVVAERRLSPEMQTSRPQIAQSAPEKPFGRSGVAAQLTGAITHLSG